VSARSTRGSPGDVTGMTVGMRLLSAGRISLSGLVTHRFGLDQINEAFATAVEKPPGFVKSTDLPRLTPHHVKQP
jgi:threonine dehydrogenase-like Zn-dependent dehydrogenase